ncbi:hypothetical protein [Negativicoccus succinicivorans]|uniref:hypothetical protein n=1 Tax=Negativicoccus succinicivorans TaxID=620903 RepID=UPI001C87AE0B|nr:hypothetical protein [Negativicoccus succinicivorans]
MHKGVRAIAKAKIVAIFLVVIVGGACIWWLFGEGGAGNINGDGVADTNARIERARNENGRAAEFNQRIEENVGRIERHQQRIESGVGSVEDIANRAEKVLNADRASIGKVRAVIDKVEKKRAKKADEP